MACRAIPSSNAWSWFYGEINVLHPFRLGNGLTQRIFFEQLAIHAGYLLNWRDVDPAGWSAACQPERDGRSGPAGGDLSQSGKRSAGI